MKIFIDPAPPIYILEGHPKFAEKAINLFSESLVQGGSFVTSVITILEFGVKPERESRQDVIQKFHELLNRLNTKIEDIDQEIATKAYQLRAKYQFLKGMDSIQIATALVSNCKEFITNDKKLKKIEEISVILIEESSAA